jgi:hypothetical protein
LIYVNVNTNPNVISAFDELDPVCVIEKHFLPRNPGAFLWREPQGAGFSWLGPAWAEGVCQEAQQRREYCI